MLGRRIATLLLTAVAAGLLAPAGALAQANPFAPLPTPQGGQQTEPAPVQSLTETEDDGLERWQEILIFVGGVALVVGIGYAILRDAKQRAPVADEAAYYRATNETNASHKNRRKAQNRKKTKAQRAARRQNR